MPKVDNAIIMAAGTSSRFAPLSFEKPKSLFPVRGEILIERQIKQLQEAGVPQIIVVVGYMKEQFSYLIDKYGVILAENKEYLTRNNTGSILAAKDYLKNSYVCSSDNYFFQNPFEVSTDGSYYSAVYSDGPTEEWCINTDSAGLIRSVTIGGRDAWYMVGHTFWDAEFSRRFLEILKEEYEKPETISALWEEIFLRHANELRMMMRKYPKDYIFEFDTLDDLRSFDKTYVRDSRSAILKTISNQIGCLEQDIAGIRPIKGKDSSAAGFRFQVHDCGYSYIYGVGKARRISK